MIGNTSRTRTSSMCRWKDWLCHNRFKKNWARINMACDIEEWKKLVMAALNLEGPLNYIHDDDEDKKCIYNNYLDNFLVAERFLDLMFYFSQNSVSQVHKYTLYTYILYRIDMLLFIVLFRSHHADNSEQKWHKCKGMKDVHSGALLRNPLR